MKLIEFYTYTVSWEGRKKVYINPEEVASIEQGRYDENTVVYMKDGRNHCVSGYAPDVAKQLTAEGGKA